MRAITWQIASISSIAVLLGTLCTLPSCNPTSDQTKKLAPGSHHALTTSTTSIKKEVVLTIPSAFTNVGYALGTGNSLKVNDRADVEGNVFNSGTGVTEFGVNASVVGNVFSSGQVVLRNNAQVNGDVTSSTPLISQGTVNGSVTIDEDIDSRQRTITVEFGPPSGDVATEPGEHTTASPGAYGRLDVKTGSSVQLEGGRYTFSEIAIHPGGELRVKGTDGNVFLFSQGNISFSGSVVSTEGGLPRVLLAAIGSQSDISVDSAFSGVLLAPNGKINIQSGGPFSGQAYAKDIELHQDRMWKHKIMYGIWDHLLDPIDCGADGFDEEEMADFLPTNPIGAAIEEYINVVYTSNSHAARLAAIQALRAFPAADVVVALRQAHDEAKTDPTRYAMLFVASDLNRVEALPLFQYIIEMEVPPHDENNLEPLIGRGATVMQAIQGTETLVRLGVSEAKPVLLWAATQHAVRAIRRHACFRILQIGDASLINDLTSSLNPDDIPFLGIVPGNLDDVEVTDDDFPNEKTKDVLINEPSVDSEVILEPDTDTVTDTNPDTGTGGTGVCDENTAIDLGAPGNVVVVPNDACVRVLAGYPSWWGTRDMKLQNTSGTSYPVPMSWSNACTSSSGSAVYTGNWQEKPMATTSIACATLIKLQGSGDGTISLTYYTYP